MDTPVRRTRRKSAKPAAAAASSAADPKVKAINVALQGGGAHGAFTWGVLDRLLEDERIVIEGISGTSAGAMNGAMLAYGMLDGGRAGARDLLGRFWAIVGEIGRKGPFQPSLFDRAMGRGGLDFSPAYQAFDFFSRILSPYQLNPQNANPIREALAELVDFERLRREATVKLFVSATNVRTGKIRVFRPNELKVECLLASACLPHVFQAVEVDGEHYWDGGFMGNPAMFPLIYGCAASDVVIVEINPIRVEEVPTSARAILDRMNDISFNATMMREMRAIASVTRLIDQHRLAGRTHLRRINFHMIQAEEAMRSYGVSSKFNADPAFLTELRDLGRETAAGWIDATWPKIGVDSSIDLEKLFF